MSAQYPATTPGSYVVSAGDTLRGIATALFGDGQLWYLIADANGLNSDADLRAGLNLSIPNKITNLRNAADTFKPYAPGQIIGDTTPTLPDPPPPAGGNGCGGAAMLIVAIVAVVATVLTAGALAGVAAQGIGAMFSAGVGVFAGTSGLTLGAAMAVGAAAGAVGSIASQGVAMAMGVQDKFSWRQVGISAVGSAVGASGAGGAVSKFAGGGLLGAMAGAATSSVITQGVGIVTGQQSKFSWSSVAASAVGAGVGYGVGQGLSGKGIDEAFGKTGADVLRGTLRGIANGAARSRLSGGTVNWGSVAADAFGNAIGNSIVDAMQSEKQGVGPWSDLDHRNGSDIESDNATATREARYAKMASLVNPELGNLLDGPKALLVGGVGVKGVIPEMRKPASIFKNEAPVDLPAYTQYMEQRYGWKFDGEMFAVPDKLGHEAASLHYTWGNGVPVQVRGETVDLSYIEPEQIQEVLAGKSKGLTAEWSLTMRGAVIEDRYVYGSVTARPDGQGGLQLHDKYDFESHVTKNPSPKPCRPICVILQPGKGTLSAKFEA